MKTAVTLMLSCALCTLAAEARKTQLAEKIPMIRLLALPQSFDKKLVQIAGVVSSKYEEVAVFPDEGSYANRITQNAVWLADGKVRGAAEVLAPLEGKWVLITGIFDAEKLGALDQFQGTVYVDNARQLAFHNIREK